MGICSSKSVVYPENQINTTDFSYNTNDEYVIKCDKEYRIIFTNTKLCSTLGYEQKALISNYIWKLFTEQDIQNYKKIIQSGLKGMTPTILTLVRKNSTHINVLYFVRQVNDIYIIKCIDLKTTINPHIPYEFQSYMYSKYSNQFITNSNSDVICIRLGMIHINNINMMDIQTYLQSIRFLLLKDVLYEHKNYIYVSLPETFHMYIVLQTTFVKQYRKAVSLSYTIAMDSVNKINDFLSLKGVTLRISCSIAQGNLTYGLLNNQYFHICGQVKDEADDLFKYVNDSSIILSETIHESLLSENTHTSMHIDINDLSNMRPFIRCMIDKEFAEHKKLTANQLLMKFLNM